MAMKTHISRRSEPKSMSDHMPVAKMSDIFKQLSDPSRLSVLHALWDRPLYVNQICAKTNLSQPNVSHHLAQLRSLGLVKMQKQGQKALYSISDSHVFTILTECQEHVEQGVRLD